MPYFPLVTMLCDSMETRSVVERIARNSGEGAVVLDGGCESS